MSFKQVTMTGTNSAQCTFRHNVLEKQFISASLALQNNFFLSVVSFVFVFRFHGKIVSSVTKSDFHRNPKVKSVSWTKMMRMLTTFFPKKT